MTKVIPLDLYRFSHKLVLRGGVIYIGTLKACQEKKRRLVARGTPWHELLILPVSAEEKTTYLRERDISVFYAFEK